MAFHFVFRTLIKTRETFPGILSWSLVDGAPKVQEFSPLECAVNSMHKTNRDLEGLLHKYVDNKDEHINALDMKLRGMIGAVYIKLVKTLHFRKI